jgi:hypothetical protein
LLILNTFRADHSVIVSKRNVTKCLLLIFWKLATKQKSGIKGEKFLWFGLIGNLNAIFNIQIMKTRPYTNKLPIGCYFDGARGSTDIEWNIIEMALEFGWDDLDALKFNEDKDPDDLNDDDYEMLSELSDSAIDYLNEQESRSYLYWQWNDGDFGLYPDVNGAKEDCEFVSSTGPLWHTNQGYQIAKEYPPDDYVGEWLHINERGNCVLYVRDEKGNDEEIWSCV